MVKVRGVELVVRKDVAAGAYDTHTFENVLRDVLPDKRFKIHGIDLIVQNENPAVDSGVRLYVLKNVAIPISDPTAALTADEEETNHGVLAELSDNLYERYNFVTKEFEEPLDFDEDDSLNLGLVLHNVAAAAAPMYCFIVVRYSEG